MAAKHVLAIDQGTTSTRAIVFDAAGQPVASMQKELPQIFPKAGWVEHDAEEIWSATVEVCRGVLGKAGLDARSLAGIGITNQRETTVVWDRATGKPIHNAIVWQDRRTADRCEALKRAGHEEMVSARTGLILDPYFSGTKIAWILDHVAGSRAAAEKGALADTLERARHYGAMARDALGLFRDSALKAALLEAVDFAIDRAN